MSDHIEFILRIIGVQTCFMLDPDAADRRRLYLIADRNRPDTRRFAHRLRYRDRNGNLKGTDFLHFYTLGLIAREHRGPELYDMKVQA